MKKKKAEEKKPSVAQTGEKRNTWLIAVLCVLSAIIVALSVAIAVVKINQDQFGPGVVKSSVQAGEISTNIAEKYIENYDVYEMIDSYREEIDNAKNGGDFQLAANLISIRSSNVAANGLCNLSLELSSEEDLEGFNSQQKSQIYSYILSTAIDCGDEAEIEKWQGLLNDVSMEMGGDDE